MGIRAARITNTSLLGKLVWDLMHSSNKLWVQLLSNKYSPSAHILRATANSSCSSIWAAIIRAKSLLLDGFEWRHGSGNSSFWFTSWNSSGSLAPLVPYIDIHDLQLTIKDVISSPAPHTNILYTTLPPDIANHINNLKVRFNDSIEDTFVWSPNINGVYTAKSGYNWLLSRSNNINTASNSWRWIWSLRLPEKFKFLIWLACHDAVPTLSLLCHRNIAHSDQCSRCGQHTETLIHCIRDCSHSSKIWRHFGFNAAEFFVENDAYLWLKQGLKGSQSTLFAATLWWIWRFRNSMCFTSEVWSLHHISFNIQDTVNVIQTSLNLHPVAAAEERVVRWNCFNHSCFIINVDGSCLGSPVQTGFGGLIRNNSGFFTVGFSGHLELSNDILFAELHAILMGLQLAKNLNIFDVVCYSDSLHCINLINGTAMVYHAYATLIEDIKDLIRITNTPILHTLREGNRCADFLAKMGALGDSALSTYTTPPHGLLPLLKDDARGTYFPRG